MLPSLSGLPATGVTLTARRPYANYWHVSTHEFTVPTTVEVTYDFAFGGRWPGALNSLFIDLSRIGQVRARPSFVAGDGVAVVEDGDSYTLYDVEHPFEAGLQVETLQTEVARRAERNGKPPQAGLEALQYDGLTQLVQAAQLIVLQRRAGGVRAVRA